MSAKREETVDAADAGLVATLDALESGEDARITTPASEEDLRRVEARLGRPIPAPLRALWLRVGGGLFVHGHEIFGPTRVMVHDIELVPDVLSVHARLVGAGRIDVSEIPFHRVGETVYVMRTAGDARGTVASVPAGEIYHDLASFLARVVRRTESGRSH